MEHLDAFKVENVARILNGKISFPNQTNWNSIHIFTGSLEFHTLADYVLIEHMLQI